MEPIKTPLDVFCILLSLVLCYFIGRYFYKRIIGAYKRRVEIKKNAIKAYEITVLYIKGIFILIFIVIILWSLIMINSDGISHWGRVH